MPEPSAPTVSPQQVREACRDILDWKVAAILAVRPTPADLAAALAWASGDDEVGQLGHALAGSAAEVYEILKADDYPEER